MCAAACLMPQEGLEYEDAPDSECIKLRGLLQVCLSVIRPALPGAWPERDSIDLLTTADK